MTRSYRLEDVVARRKQKEFDLQERLRKVQNGIKADQRDLRKRNRATAGRILERDGFLDLPTEEFNAGLHLWGVIREEGLLSRPAEAERCLRESAARKNGTGWDKVETSVAEPIPEAAE